MSGTFIKARQRWVALLALAAGLACGMGCNTVQPGASGKDPIVQLNLISLPVALDMDGVAGPDGVSVRVFANTAREPKPVAIRSGTLELLLFDGTFIGRTNVPPPLRTFAFTVPELKYHEFKAKIGIGYDFQLRWGENRPTQRLMSVAARYTAADGRIVTSRPSSITVLDR